MWLLVLRSRVNIRVWLHEDYTENTDFLHDYRLALLRLDSRTHPHSHFLDEWCYRSLIIVLCLLKKKKKKERKKKVLSPLLHWLCGNRVELSSGTAQLHSLMKEVNRTGLQPGLGAFLGKVARVLRTEHALISTWLRASFASIAAGLSAFAVLGSACHVQPQQQEERLQQIGR